MNLTSRIPTGDSGLPLTVKAATRPSESSPTRVRCSFLVQLSRADILTMCSRLAEATGEEMPAEAVDALAQEEVFAGVCDFRLEMN